MKNKWLLVLNFLTIEGNYRKIIQAKKSNIYVSVPLQYLRSIKLYISTRHCKGYYGTCHPHNINIFINALSKSKDTLHIKDRLNFFMQIL